MIKESDCITNDGNFVLSLRGNYLFIRRKKSHDCKTVINIVHNDEKSARSCFYLNTCDYDKETKNKLFSSEEQRKSNLNFEYGKSYFN